MAVDATLQASITIALTRLVQQKRAVQVQIADAQRERLERCQAYTLAKNYHEALEVASEDKYDAIKLRRVKLNDVVRRLGAGELISEDAISPLLQPLEIGGIEQCDEEASVQKKMEHSSSKPAKRAKNEDATVMRSRKAMAQANRSNRRVASWLETGRVLDDNAENGIDQELALVPDDSSDGDYGSDSHVIFHRRKLSTHSHITVARPSTPESQPLQPENEDGPTVLRNAKNVSLFVSGSEAESDTRAVDNNGATTNETTSGSRTSSSDGLFVSEEPREYQQGKTRKHGSDEIDHIATVESINLDRSDGIAGEFGDSHSQPHITYRPKVKSRGIFGSGVLDVPRVNRRDGHWAGGTHQHVRLTGSRKELESYEPLPRREHPNESEAEEAEGDEKHSNFMRDVLGPDPKVS